MTTYYAIVFELREDTPVFKKRLKELLEKNFDKFTSGIRESRGLKVYMKEGEKLVVE